MKESIEDALPNVPAPDDADDDAAFKAGMFGWVHDMGREQWLLETIDEQRLKTILESRHNFTV